jgi:uncharacterized protein (DUF1697 family)
MKTFIVLLRGINVSGQKKIKMADLRESLKALNLDVIQTYIQSGNLILKTDAYDERSLAQAVHDVILNDFGFEVPTQVINRVDWQWVVQNNPYLNDDNLEGGRLYVTFLSKQPTPECIQLMNKFDCAPDEFSICGTVIYLLCSTGYGKTKLDNNKFERKLKVSATSRNWKTTLKLLELSSN